MWLPSMISRVVVCITGKGRPRVVGSDIGTAGRNDPQSC